MAATISFYGGVNEIGGNKILIQDGETRVFFDFGKNFTKEGLYFEEPFIRARKESNLLDLGILPNIEGLYKNDPRPCNLDAVFISHPHTDHYDSIRFIKDTCPIQCSAIAS